MYEDQKKELDLILNPLGFSMQRLSQEEWLYNHIRVPMFIKVYKGTCKLTYNIDSELFSSMSNTCKLDRDAILVVMNGFKDALIKLGLK